MEDGLSLLDVARVLYLDEESIQAWRHGFEKAGFGSLDLKAYSKRDSHLTTDQEAKLGALFLDKPPKTTDEVRGVINTVSDSTLLKTAST